MDPKLCEAAMNGDLNYFEEIIIKSQLPLDLLSQLTPNNNSVLHIAVEFNQTAFVKAIIQHCPSLLWLQNSVRDTPLHVAARSEALQDILEILIAKSKTVEIEMAQSGREIKVLRMVNSENDTALHCAARLGNARCVELLVQADPELCSFVNKAKESPIYLAAASGNSSALQFILDVASDSTPYKGPNGLTALHVAQLVSNFGYKENKMLVDWRRQMITDTDTDWNSESTPLHYASLYGKTEAVKLFLEFDSSAIYLLKRRGDSALHVAAFFGHVDTLKELINRRPDSCYLINNLGRTVLHAAVSGNQGHVVKFILKTPRLALVTNKPDEDGNTPLHLAASLKSHDMIKILAKCKSVYLGIKNKQGLTALQNFHKEGDNTSEMTPPFLESFVALGGMKVETSRNLSDPPKKLNMIGNQNENVVIDNPEWEKRRSSAKANMIIGTLVATVSFAAGFTMPGGYMSDGADEGLATFTHKPAFQAFIVSNAIAFCSSTLGVLFHFHSSMVGLRNRHKYFEIAVSLIGSSLYAIFVAFCAGNYAVLAKSLPLSIAPMLILGVFLIIASFTLDIMRLTKLLVDHIWYLLSDLVNIRKM